jgi:hypothetical protein
MCAFPSRKAGPFPQEADHGTFVAIRGWSRAGQGRRPRERYLPRGALSPTHLWGEYGYIQRDEEGKGEHPEAGVYSTIKAGLYPEFCRVP